MNTNLYIVFELVFKFSTPNGISTFPCMCWVSGLNNEALYIPMKQTAIIIVTGTKCKKILTSLGAILTKQLNLYISNICVNSDRLELSTFVLDSIPDRPARSQSLYRLSYPAHVVTFVCIYMQ